MNKNVNLCQAVCLRICCLGGMNYQILPRSINCGRNSSLLCGIWLCKIASGGCHRTDPEQAAADNERVIDGIESSDSSISKNGVHGSAVLTLRSCPRRRQKSGNENSVLRNLISFF